MDFLSTLLPKIEHLGLFAYWVLFGVGLLESTAVVGLLIPGTTITVFFGFLAAQKAVDLGDVIWAAALGGSVLSPRLFLRPGLGKSRSLARAH